MTLTLSAIFTSALSTSYAGVAKQEVEAALTQVHTHPQLANDDAMMIEQTLI
jgi:hypothetical protein